MDTDTSSVVVHIPDDESYIIKDLGRDMFPESVIYKVRERFCKGKEESYRPRVVSIGPYYYKSLRSASIKLYYASSFTNGYKGTSPSIFKEVPQNTSGRMGRKSQDLLFRVRRTKLRRSRFPEYRRGVVADPIFHRTRILIDVYRDILLIENQLPWFVLDELYQELVLPHPRPNEKDVNLDRLAHDFFKAYLVDNNNIGNRIPTTTTNDDFFFLDEDSKDHLAAFVRSSFYSPRGKSTPSSSILSFDCPRRKSTLSSLLLDGDINITVELIPPSVTVLYEAGIRFEKLIPTSCGLDIKFDRGSLKIPYLDYRTGTLLLNLMVFEENSDFPSGGNYVTQYMFFMGCMIRNSKDVDILIESGIISSTLGSKRDLVALFDRISKMGWPHAYFFLFVRNWMNTARVALGTSGQRLSSAIIWTLLENCFYNCCCYTPDTHYHANCMLFLIA